MVAHGGAAGIAGSSEGSEALAEARAEVARLKAELDRANEDFKQVLYTASHDLAEPLQIVLSYAELLAARSAGEIDNRAQRYVAGIQSGATRLRALIDGLLAYSRLGNPLVREEVDCCEVLGEVLERLGGRIAETGATVAVDALPTVSGSHLELVRLFENLIDNAMKFRATDPPRVRVSATRGRDDWCFAVRDNGIGIHARQHDRVFEIFQRLHTRDEYTGTGMGLALCKKIVERHGGRIWVESRPGLGSTFRFTISD